MAWRCKMEWYPSLFKIPFTLYNSPTLPAPKQPRPSHYFHHAWQMASGTPPASVHIYLFINVLLCDPNTSNLDSSVHNTFFQSSPVQWLCSFAHLNLFLLLAVSDMAFSLPLCLEGQHPGVASSLRTLRLAFLRVPFNEAASWGPVRRLFLKLETLMYLSSCLVVHRGLPLLFLFWLEPVCAVLWRE